MSVREGLEFETEIQSDSAPLNGMVAALLAITPEIHVLRDPTRGGMASALNEIARAAKVGGALADRLLPVRPEGAAAGGMSTRISSRRISTNSITFRSKRRC